MKRASISLALLVLTLALVVAGCGGGSGDVPSSAVAVVDGTEIPRSELDAYMAQSKAKAKADGVDFAKVGTPEYQGYQQQWVAFLVQVQQFEQEAAERGLEITDADVEKLRDDYVKNTFGGDERKLAADLEEQGMSDEAFLKALRIAVLNEKIFDSVTKDIKVTDTDALAAFSQDSTQFGGKPESRDVRHILIAEKSANGQVDFAKSKAEADRVYAELEGGADFAALAKELSADTASAKDGGKYTANRGASVPEFDKAAFELDTNEISQPVRTQFGYHLIQPITDIAPPTSFEDVKAVVKSSLLQTKRTETMTEWVEELQKRYEGKVSYSPGFAPPALPDATTETK
jgi:parvulin-like peptidyl-prolyl isomerase